MVSDADLDDLSLRLEIGLPGECVPLARKIGNLLTRGEYLALLGAGQLDPETIGSKQPNELSMLTPASAKRLIEACSAE